MARKVNRYQTKQEFFETMMLNLALHGNAYAKITKVGGQIRSILPLMSAQVTPSLLADGMRADVGAQWGTPHAAVGWFLKTAIHRIVTFGVGGWLAAEWVW